jgi:hypothetical protein
LEILKEELEKRERERLRHRHLNIPFEMIANSHSQKYFSAKQLLMVITGKNKAQTKMILLKQFRTQTTSLMV